MGLGFNCGIRVQIISFSDRPGRLLGRSAISRLLVPLEQVTPLGPDLAQDLGTGGGYPGEGVQVLEGPAGVDDHTAAV